MLADLAAHGQQCDAMFSKACLRVLHAVRDIDG